MSRRTGIIGIASIVLAMVVVAAPAQAGAKAVRVATEVTIEGLTHNWATDTVTFRGRVDCPRARCRRGRRVVLLNTDLGKVAGRGRTRADGRWTIRFKAAETPPGRFRARARGRVLRVKRRGKLIRRIACRAGRSKVLDTEA